MLQQNYEPLSITQYHQPFPDCARLPLLDHDGDVGQLLHALLASDGMH